MFALVLHNTMEIRLKHALTFFTYTYNFKKCLEIKKIISSVSGHPEFPSQLYGHKRNIYESLPQLLVGGDQ